MGPATRPDQFGYGPNADAAELADAIANGLLSKEEARTIYWAQFPVLQQQQSVTPPAIES